MPSGYTTALPTSICPDVAVLYRDISSTSTPIGVSRGGLTFDPSIEIRNVEFDGKRSNIEGLDRITYRTAKFSGTIIELTTVNVQSVLEPGSSSATATTTGSPITITPKTASGLLTAATHYLANVKMSWTRTDNKVITVTFAKAICSKYSIKSQDKDETVVDVEFEARLDATAAATSTDTCPYTIVIV